MILWSVEYPRDRVNFKYGQISLGIMTKIYTSVAPSIHSSVKCFGKLLYSIAKDFISKWSLSDLPPMFEFELFG
jgi:hypothetical protein